MIKRDRQNTGRTIISRPLVISVLAGFSIFFSLLFILSPDASSEKFFKGFPVIKGHTPKVKTSAMLSEYSDTQPRVERHDIVLKDTDSFYGVLTALEVPGAEISRIVRKTRPVYDLRRMQAGTVLKATVIDGQWDRFEYKVDDFDLLVIAKDPSDPDGFTTAMTEIPFEIREVQVAGTIENSLYEAGVKAGADPQVLMTLSDIFAWDIDFTSDIRRGDRFSIIYEVIYVEGRMIRTNRILGAEMTNDGKNFTAIYYEGDDGVSGYYDANGKSLRRTLLKSPLRYRRVTSYFTKRRFHPILKKYRPHHGIDYGAPVGTPVESAGSGRVVYAGWKGGYGKYIKIKHRNSYSTAYGHLSRIKKGIRVGAKVNQGDVIGYVGSTGVSTGPHLHYEVRRGKSLINPLGIKSAPVGRIPEKEFDRFAKLRDELSERLSGVDTILAAGQTSGGAESGAMERKLVAGAGR